MCVQDIFDKSKHSFPELKATNTKMLMKYVCYFLSCVGWKFKLNQVNRIILEPYKTHARFQAKH